MTAAGSCFQTAKVAVNVTVNPSSRIVRTDHCIEGSVSLDIMERASFTLGKLVVELVTIVEGDEERLSNTGGVPYPGLSRQNAPPYRRFSHRFASDPMILAESVALEGSRLHHFAFSLSPSPPNPSVLCRFAVLGFSCRHYVEASVYAAHVLARPLTSAAPVTLLSVAPRPPQPVSAVVTSHIPTAFREALIAHLQPHGSATAGGWGAEIAAEENAGGSHGGALPLEPQRGGQASLRGVGSFTARECGVVVGAVIDKDILQSEGDVVEVVVCAALRVQDAWTAATRHMKALAREAERSRVKGVGRGCGLIGAPEDAGGAPSVVRGGGGSASGKEAVVQAVAQMGGMERSTRRGEGGSGGGGGADGASLAAGAADLNECEDDEVGGSGGGADRLPYDRSPREAPHEKFSVVGVGPNRRPRSWAGETFEAVEGRVVRVGGLPAVVAIEGWDGWSETCLRDGTREGGGGDRSGIEGKRWGPRGGHGESLRSLWGELWSRGGFGGGRRPTLPPSQSYPPSGGGVEGVGARPATALEAGTAGGVRDWGRAFARAALQSLNATLTLSLRSHYGQFSYCVSHPLDTKISPLPPDSATFVRCASDVAVREERGRNELSNGQLPGGYRCECPCPCDVVRWKVRYATPAAPHSSMLNGWDADASVRTTTEESVRTVDMAAKYAVWVTVTFHAPGAAAAATALPGTEQGGGKGDAHQIHFPIPVTVVDHPWNSTPAPQPLLPPHLTPSAAPSLSHLAALPAAEGVAGGSKLPTTEGVTSSHLPGVKRSSLPGIGADAKFCTTPCTFA